MTDNTTTTTSGGANTRTNQYSGRGADHSGRGGRGGRGRSSNNGRGGGRNNGGGRSRGNQHDLTRKSSHSGQVQSGCLKGLTISSDGNRATQYKVLKDCLPVFCAEKTYTGVGEIIRNLQDWDESTFYPDPPDVDERKRYSQPIYTEICKESKKVTRQRQVTKKDSAGQDVQVTEDYKVIIEPPVLGTKWVVFDENVQKIVMGKYEQEVRKKEKK